MSREYRARHHKYLDQYAVADARDQILEQHQRAGVGPVGQAVQVASDQVEIAAASAISPPRKPPTTAVAVAEPEPPPQPDAPLDLPPYVPVRPRGIKVAGVAPIDTFTAAVTVLPPIVVPAAYTPPTASVLGIPVQVDATMPLDTIEFRDPAGTVIGKIEDVALPLDADPEPVVEYTLDSLPIGQHTFEYLCGTAGSGKTWLSRKLLELSPKGSVVLAATTGIASVNLGEGTTVNALAGFFNTADLIEKYQNGHLQRQLRRLRASGLRRILLDEVSMMDARQLTVLTRAIHEVNQPRDRALESVGSDQDFDADDVPAGDLPPQMGLTLVGDFAQLSPVPDDGPIDPRTGRPTKIPAQYAFESPEWWRFAEHTHRLTKIWRQSDQAFVQALHAVRRADLAAAMTFFTKDRFVDQTDLHFDGTTIFAKNIEVERHNQLRLDALRTPELRSESIRWGKQRPDWKQIPDVLTLKETALVMCLANRRELDSRRMIYANGDLGTLVRKHSDGVWKVLLKRTNQIVDVVMQLRENLIPLSPGRRKEIKEWEQAREDQQTEKYDLLAELREGRAEGRDLIALQEKIARLDRQLKEPRPEGLGMISEDGKSEIIGTIVYMPLRCAYAATCHKSQGLTLDTVQINIRDSFFKHPGMLFVALSRARTPDGLRLVGDPRGFMERCTVDRRVTPWL
jgi:hypothetical protein